MSQSLKEVISDPILMAKPHHDVELADFGYHVGQLAHFLQKEQQDAAAGGGLLND